MKVILTITVILLSIVNINAADVCSKVDETFLKQHLPIYNFTIENKRSVNGMCETVIKIQNQLVTIYAGANFVISGSMYHQKRVLNDESIKKIHMKNFSKYKASLEKVKAFEYSPDKKGERSIYMFTDPLCTYCSKAEILIKQFADKHKISVKYILIAAKGVKSKKKVIEAVCREFDLKEYHDQKWKKEPVNEKYQCRKGKDTFVEADVLSDKLMVRGTPAFYTDQGVYINGFDIEMLEASYLQKNKEIKVSKK